MPNQLFIYTVTFDYCIIVTIISIDGNGCVLLKGHWVQTIIIDPSAVLRLFYIAVLQLFFIYCSVCFCWLPLLQLLGFMCMFVVCKFVFYLFNLFVYLLICVNLFCWFIYIYLSIYLYLFIFKFRILSNIRPANYRKPFEKGWYLHGILIAGIHVKSIRHRPEVNARVDTAKILDLRSFQGHFVDNERLQIYHKSENYQILMKFSEVIQ